MKPGVFWATAVTAAVVASGVIAVAFPYTALGLESPAERERAWLLTTWTAGVLAICFGATGLLSSVAPISFRDVAEAGSVHAAIEARRGARRGQSPSFYNFAGWTVATGLCMILVYFVGWLVLSR